MKKQKRVNKLFVNIGILLVFCFTISCSDNNDPGFEYMPNMYRSPSIGVYTENNIDGYNSTPVHGTVSRGNLSSFNYSSSNEDYLKAGNEVTYPKDFIKDDKHLDEGKQLYLMMCSHCHGANGDGKGSVNHPVYSAIPSYADSVMIRRTGGPMRELKLGHLFHAITYGLNAMGPHAYQTSEEERWKIVYYIKEKLQKK